VVVKTDIEGAFDGITYQKGSAVISMFEGWFGPDKFREGVRGFLAKHEYANATSDDLRDHESAQGESRFMSARSWSSRACRSSISRCNAARERGGRYIRGEASAPSDRRPGSSLDDAGVLRARTRWKTRQTVHGAEEWRVNAAGRRGLS
jgi:hypothetical protein